LYFIAFCVRVLPSSKSLIFLKCAPGTISTMNLSASALLTQRSVLEDIAPLLDIRRTLSSPFVEVVASSSSRHAANPKALIVLKQTAKRRRINLRVAHWN
jgi:hypothetical protein